jgi:hypothetical protein
MTPPFSVQSAPHYERLAKKLFRGHPDFLAVQTRAGAILCADPYNASRQHHIKKLEGVAAGEGQPAKASFASRWDGGASVTIS